jgi:hypothetical protein
MANTRTQSHWRTEDAYWREHFRNRPYAQAGREYDYYSPAYHFGYEASDRYSGRSWNDVEADLEHDWERYEYRGASTWQQMKNAVKDAWDRMVGNR